jgi:hypothetical protein
MRVMRHFPFKLSFKTLKSAPAVENQRTPRRKTRNGKPESERPENGSDPKSADPKHGPVRKITTVRNLPKIDRKVSCILNPLKNNTYEKYPRYKLRIEYSWCSKSVFNLTVADHLFVCYLRE